MMGGRRKMDSGIPEGGPVLIRWVAGVSRGPLEKTIGKTALPSPIRLRSIRGTAEGGESRSTTSR